MDVDVHRDYRRPAVAGIHRRRVVQDEGDGTEPSSAPSYWPSWERTFASGYRPVSASPMTLCVILLWGPVNR